MRRSRVLLVAVLVGIVGATAYAVLAGTDTKADTSDASSAGARGSRAATSTPVPTSRAPTPDPGPLPRERVRRVATGAVGERTDIELRVRKGTMRHRDRKDPGGGPTWRLRTFVADRIVKPRSRRKGVDPRIGTNRCAQLGRLHGGRFGWLDSDGTFRPVAPGYRGAPVRCTPRKQLAVVRLATFGYPGSRHDQARLRRTVVFAAAPDDVRLQARRGGRRLARGKGSLLVLADPGVRPADVQVGAVPPDRTPPQPSDGPAVDPAKLRVIARAADPAGGLPLVALLKDPKAKRRTVCFGTALRAIGDRAGAVDFALGVFRETLQGSSYGCGGAEPQLPDRPVGVASQIGGGVPIAGSTDDRAAQRRRRTLPGRTILAGLADPAVRSITVRSPQDVRTLRPTGPQHGYLVVYDGAFTSGEFTITSTLASGRTVDQQVGAAP